MNTYYSRTKILKFSKTYTYGQTISIFYPASGGSDDWGYDIMLFAGNNDPFRIGSVIFKISYKNSRVPFMSKKK